MYEVIRSYYSQKSYYIGKDYITAPEISQMFGEILAAYCIDWWRRFLYPNKHLYIIELGGGNGTLMYDFLRVFSKLCRGKSNINIYMIESSNSMELLQRSKLSIFMQQYCIKWFGTLSEVISEIESDSYVMIVSNEFLDALPIKQYQITEQRKLKEIMITKDDKDHLSFTHSIYDVRNIDFSGKKVGSYIEDPTVAKQTIYQMIEIIDRAGAGMALMVDYGYIADNDNSTLQGLRGHNHEDILKDISKNDITTLVNFGLLKQYIEDNYTQISCMIERQRDFLIRNGIIERSEMLISYNRDNKAMIERQLYRLLHVEEMGNLFKVMTLSNKEDKSSQENKIK